MGVNIIRTSDNTNKTKAIEVMQASKIQQYVQCQSTSLTGDISALSTEVTQIKAMIAENQKKFGQYDIAKVPCLAPRFNLGNQEEPEPEEVEQVVPNVVADMRDVQPWIIDAQSRLAIIIRERYPAINNLEIDLTRSPQNQLLIRCRFEIELSVINDEELEIFKRYL